jgi:hypothetical protein
MVSPVLVEPIWDQRNIDQQVTAICAMFKDALKASAPNYRAPEFSQEAGKLLRDASMVACQLRSRQITRDHLIVALLRTDTISLNMALASGRTYAYDDQALLAGALIRISSLPPGEYREWTPGLTDPKAQQSDDDTETSDEPGDEPATGEPENSSQLPLDPLLRWTLGASEVAHDSGEDLHPRHFEKFATMVTNSDNRALKRSLKAIAALGRPSRSLTEWQNVKESLQKTTYTARDEVAAKLAPISALLTTSGKQVATLDSKLDSGLGNIGRSIAELASSIPPVKPSVEPFNSKPVTDAIKAVGDTVTELRGQLVSKLSEKPSKTEQESKFDELNAKLAALSQQLPHRPSATLLTASIAAAILIGIAVGYTVHR